MGSRKPKRLKLSALYAVPIVMQSRHHWRLRPLHVRLPMTRRIAARRSPIHGNGVFAVAPIKKGEEIIEYKGTMMTHAQADKMYGDGGETGHTFLFTLNDDYIIDANRKGNTARWINHSCNPNCQAFVVENESGDPRKDRVIIEARRNIKPGEELTYDYGIVLEVPHTARLKKLWVCLCGSPKCTGTLLKPKR
jgi:SET domain-containing protein